MVGGRLTSTDDQDGAAAAPWPAHQHDLAWVEFEDRNGVRVAAISGEVDVSNAGEVAGAFSDLSGLSAGLVIDLSGLEYLDSSGIALLHDLALRLRERFQRVIVVSPPSTPPRRVLELTALDSQTLILDEL
ncbi:MAG TPA: STAS domain-containing protein, partial [Solirubrobacteraceae bacterium]